MSKQPEQNFEGLTFKVTGCIVDLTYNGVKPTPGNEARGAYMDQVRQLAAAQAETKETENISQPKSSASALVIQIPADEVKSGGKIPNFSETRDSILVDFASINRKVANFHHQLNLIKEDILAGRTSVVIGPDQINDIRTKMEPYNVGKVYKIQLISRGFSNTPVAKWNKCAGGGFSSTRTCYTLYFEIVEGKALQTIVDSVAKWFREGMENPVEVEVASLGARVERGKGGKITITPMPAPHVMTAFDSKTQETTKVPIEAIKQPNSIMPQAFDRLKELAKRKAPAVKPSG